jgi:hypothetical protein
MSIWLRRMAKPLRLGRAESRSLAAIDTPKAQEGTWMLIAPDGRHWEAESPLKCASAEQRERVPAHVAVARIMAEIDDEAPMAVVYPPDGTVSPFTVINLGMGAVQMGDCIHDRRIPALWFGKDGKGMGHEEEMNREAHDGETLAVVTFANVEGLDVLLKVLHRVRRKAFPDAASSGDANASA